MQAIIGECPPFEYYIASPHLDWLIGENHHNVIFAVGETVVHNLSQIGESTTTKNQALSGNPSGNTI